MGGLRVYSIFSSIQGESTRAGLPCAFVRLAGCPLRCAWCDTRAACESPGEPRSIEEVAAAVERLGPGLVEVTGGEPLFQDEAHALLRRLCDAGREVLLETSGALPIDRVDTRVRVVMDVKCPASFMVERFCRSNLRLLGRQPFEIKFVVADRADFDFAVRFAIDEGLAGRAELLVAPVFGALDPALLASWLLAAPIPLRLQLQLHRIIWMGEEGER